MLVLFCWTNNKCVPGSLAMAAHLIIHSYIRCEHCSLSNGFSALFLFIFFIFFWVFLFLSENQGFVSDPFKLCKVRCISQNGTCQSKHWDLVRIAFCPVKMCATRMRI